MSLKRALTAAAAAGLLAAGVFAATAPTNGHDSAGHTLDRSGVVRAGHTWDAPPAGDTTVPTTDPTVTPDGHTWD